MYHICVIFIVYYNHFIFVSIDYIVLPTLVLYFIIFYHLHYILSVVLHVTFA